MRIKNSYKLYLLTIGLLFLIVISDNSHIVNAVDNYSEYIFNQEIDINNDKAHLLKDRSDGSNSYRNILESNFLFPAKLQNDMFSTFPTSEYTHYSINQVYFNNLDNEYNYANSNPIDNEVQDIELNDYTIEKGVNAQDGNTTNYGHYNSTYSFENEIGHTLGNIDFINSYSIPYAEILEYNSNHQAILNISTVINWKYIANFFESPKTYGFIEFWINQESGSCRLLLDGESIYIIFCSTYTEVRYGNGEGTYTSFSFNTVNSNWNHYSLSWFCKSEFVGNFSLWNNNVLKASNLPFVKYLKPSSFSTLYFYLSTNSNFLLDAIDYNWSSYYYFNRNYYPESDIFQESFLNMKELYPNEQFLTEFNVLGGTHYSVLRDKNFDYNTEIYTNQQNKRDSFGFDNYTTFFNATKIIANIHVYTLDTTGFNLKCTLLNTNDILYNAIPFNTDTNSSFIFNNINMNVNDIRIEVSSNNVEGSIYIYSMYIHVLFNSTYNDAFLFNVEYENNINILYDNPIQFDLYYSFFTNYSCNSKIMIYNYDLLTYTLVNLDNFYNDKEIYVFTLNESGYFRFNKIKIRIYTNTTLNNNILIIDTLYLEITYVVQNELGYQNIIIYNYRYDITDYKGYTKFEVNIYKNNLTYQYSEINLYTDDYIYTPITVNTSTYDLKELEIQCHCRYGLNTLDQNIINFLYIIEFNYNESLKIEFREQTRKELTSNSIKSNINYTSYNCNYLNQTGIVGNYSYNSLSGFRCLYASNTELFHRYFSIPYFNEGISLSKPTVNLATSSGIGSEPDYPSSEYWSYQTFRVVDDYLYSYSYENWSIDYAILKTETYEAKYFYKSKSYDDDDFGSWKWKIKFSDIFSYTVDFNFMRNAVVLVVNLILLFFQVVFFLVVASLSFIIMYLGCNIIVFVWNYALFYIFIAIVMLLWFMFDGIITSLEFLIGQLILYLDYLFGWLWNLLQDFYLYVIIPFFDWFLNIGFPYIVEFIIIPIIAFILTVLIWILTLGSMDFATLYDLIHDNLLIVSDIFIELVYEIVNNIVGILAFLSLYVIMILLCFFKHIIVKTRGFTNRAYALQQSYEAYLYPIILFYNLIIKIKNLIAGWM